jgi:uncharacterized protein YbbK (DUF523 family)
MPDQKKILISACLTGIRCRYNGEHCKDERLLASLADFELIPACPEQLGGLPTPRKPAEIIGGEGKDVLSGQATVQTRCGKDVSSSFIVGAQKTLDIAGDEGIGMAVMKQKSPSCGCGLTYDGSFKRRLISGDGVTTALMKQKGIICRAAEEFIIGQDYY